jgi:hypothetical protein
VATTPSRRITAAIILGLGAGLVTVVSAVGPRFGAEHSLAADATPPLAPTFVPTPIGNPPAPPTFTPGTTASPTAVTTATSVATVGGATTTPVATATAIIKKVAFTLDAARVAHINNPGNFAGLIAVKRGKPVWLMMYYTVESIPKSETRTTTYTILQGGKTLYKVAYKGTVKSSELGRFSRYQVFTVPATLPFGKYSFRATLTIGSVTKTKTWPFTVGNREVAAKVSR